MTEDSFNVDNLIGDISSPVDHEILEQLIDEQIRRYNEGEESPIEDFIATLNWNRPPYALVFRSALYFNCAFGDIFESDSRFRRYIYKYSDDSGSGEIISRALIYGCSNARMIFPEDSQGETEFDIDEVVSFSDLYSREQPEKSKDGTRIKN